jgi:hypothetical protein
VTAVIHGQAGIGAGDRVIGKTKAFTQCIEFSNEQAEFGGVARWLSTLSALKQ